MTKMTTNSVMKILQEQLCASYRFYMRAGEKRQPLYRILQEQDV